MPIDSDSTIIAAPKCKHRLKPQEQAFIAAYADPASSTFGNGTQSYLVAKPNTEYRTANVMASKWLSRDSVSESVADILNQHNLGIEVRADSLRRIIGHKQIGKCVSKVRHAEDETITTTESGPAYRDILKSIDLLNKIDGTYDRNRAAADIASTEYRSLVKRFFSCSDRGPRRTRGEGGQTAPEVLDVSPMPKPGEFSEGGGLENPSEIS